MNRKNGACKTFLCVLAVGTAALLTARFIAEATTIGTDIAVSGTFSVSGLSSLTGNVGVASSSPWSKFSVEMSTEEYSFAVSNSGSSTPALVIGGVNRNGNIGIGTTTPDSVLHIYRSVPFKTGVESTPLVMIESDLTGAQDSIALAIGERIGLGSVVLGYAPSANDNSSLLYVPSSGILMSGSDAPSGLSIITQNASGPIRFATGGTAFSNERLRITAGGNLGIGTT
ncbi:hypothetical protein HY406_00290, partial [Candidatus Giovannonibacteria bacterium]|nr:hypothetical protein [Candidatus Giovannonibacteria bacterium]